MRSILLAAIFAVAPACTTDIGGTPAGGGGGGGGGDDTGGGGGGGGTTDTGRISATVDMDAVTTELGQTVKLTYSLASMNGYAGTVTATPSVANAGGTAVAGWTLTPDQPSVALVADGTAQIVLTVAIPTNDAELAPIVKLGLSDGTTNATVSSNFTVMNQVTVMLDVAGSASGLHTTWPAKNAPLHIKSGATVIFHNSDVVAHEIHSGGGIPHESGSLAAGAEYKIANVTDDASWYCHDHESGADSRGVVVE
jgi:hypothetical protein